MALMHDLAGWRFCVQGRGYGPFASDRPALATFAAHLLALLAWTLHAFAR